TREAQDEWALTSQTRAEKAWESGVMQSEVSPVEIKERGGTRSFAKDEFIRGAASGSKLPTLKPAFMENGTVTAGNASGINDGASAILVASENFVKKTGAKPLAKILGWAS